eukprot:1158129-Pelagomonas_calceolata.AAC.4
MAPGGGEKVKARSQEHQGKAGLSTYNSMCVCTQANVGLPVDPSAPVFAFIGRLEEQKGADILVEALPQIVKEAPNAQVSLCALSQLSQIQPLDVMSPCPLNPVIGQCGGAVLMSGRRVPWHAGWHTHLQVCMRLGLSHPNT